MNKIHSYDISMVDSSNTLTKNGFINLCQKYGSIKNITIYKNQRGNRGLVEFKDKNSAQRLINEKSNFPYFIKVDLLNKTQHTHICSENENNEDIETFEVIENLKTTSSEVVNDEFILKQSVYFGQIITNDSLLKESNQFKSNEQIPYNLENDDLFGRPINTKLEKIEKFCLELNHLDFYNRFENSKGGEIKIEKKLSQYTFTGWTTSFIHGENVQEKLKVISDDIEHSDFLNINNLKRGMLVGALDITTSLYGRGYVTLIAGNSVNVALSDFGRVINSNIIKTLPEKYNQLPAYAFKVYTKENCVPQLKEKSYTFKVQSACFERIVLIIIDEDKEIKVQLKKWQPTVDEFGVPYVDLNSGSSVEILKLKNMNSVYLRSREKHHLDFFFTIWNKVAVYCYKNPQSLNREPFYGEIIGFKSTILNNYVRARIHKYLGDNIYSVKHMDNPLKENISSSKMIELQFEQKCLPVTFIKVGLKNALQYPIQFNAKDFITNVIGVPLSVHFDRTKIEGWRCVDLNISIVKENLNIILYNLIEPIWLKDIPINQANDTSIFCTFPDLLKNELKEKSVVNMKFVMYHEGIFIMRDKLFGKSFTLLSNMIREYCNLSLNPYLPHNDEVCLGQYPDDTWYRVICNNMKPGELVKVHSVDLGNVAYLNTRNMKRLPEELLFHPVHVYLCILDKPFEIDAKKIELLQKYENTDCEFTVIKNLGGKNHYSITCPFLENILQ